MAKASMGSQPKGLPCALLRYMFSAPWSSISSFFFFSSRRRHTRFDCEFRRVLFRSSSGDGGGLIHGGFSKNGLISHNSILFNQSTNPTIPANGGGIVIMGTPDVDPPCSTVDQDCLSAPNLIGPSDGAGPGLVIDANLIMGNAAESGSGGGHPRHNRQRPR